MKKLGKKGVLDRLGTLVQALGFMAVLLAVTFLVLAETQAQTEEIGGTNTTAWNATRDTITAMSTIPGWLPIIVIAVVGGLLLALIQVFRK